MPVQVSEALFHLYKDAAVTILHRSCNLARFLFSRRRSTGGHHISIGSINNRRLRKLSGSHLMGGKFRDACLGCAVAYVLEQEEAGGRDEFIHSVNIY